jgi:hypothetical protein
VSSPPILVWTSWSSTGSSPKGTPTRGVVFGPGSSLQIWNAGQDASSLNTVLACCEIVFCEVHLGLGDGEFIVEMAWLVVLSTITLDFSGGVPIVEVGNSATEGVVGRGWAIEKSVEPNGDGLGDVLR